MKNFDEVHTEIAVDQNYDKRLCHFKVNQKPDEL